MDSIHRRLITADIDMQYPKSASEPSNRLAVTVEYRLNGKLHSQVFYFDGDGRSISHCSSDLQKLIQNTDESLREFRQVHDDF
jgi:hypothetical protein